MNIHSETTTGASRVSIGIIAWNEEKAIGPMLQSLFGQSLFTELARRGQHCEILCLANGCTDRTTEIASNVFAEQMRAHAAAGEFSCRVLELEERGKIKAWNFFVHSASAREAEFLFLMDADILLHRRDTLWNMMRTLETRAEASVSVDRPCKDLEFRPPRSLGERLSLNASSLTRSGAGQLCGQLYCIRSSVARNIYLPRDLTACDDGLIKALVCTDFLAHPAWPMRIQPAHDAAHTFVAYTSLSGLLKNQKRQVIGQTMVHLLVDRYLKTLSPLQRSRLAETLREHERRDPDWLKRLVSDHVRRVRFGWQLYPGLAGHAFRRLAEMSFWKKVVCFPAAAARSALALIAGSAALRFLRSGDTAYWPRADRGGFEQFDLETPRAAQFTR